MTQQILNSLLEKFRQLPAESEWLEFKAAKNNFHFDSLGKFFSALSNEANLKKKDNAWLIFGIHDKTRNIEGSNYRPNRGHLDSLKSEIANHTNGRITFIEIHELNFSEGRVILFQIPPAPQGIPVSWKGHYYGRDDEELQPLNIQEIETIRNQTNTYDWSEKIVANAGLEDLEAEAITFARVQYKEKFPDYASRCDAWDDITFLNKVGLTIKGKITNAAILLLGKQESASLILPANPRIIWNLKDGKNMERDYQIFSIPFLLVPDKVLQKIRILKYRYLRRDTMFPTEIDQYNSYVLRETLHNCIAHQDYEIGHRIQVIEFPEELLYVNAGSFVAGTVEEVIESDAPPQRYRNRFLANAMHNLRMIDTQGGGIKKIFTIQRERYFPMPDYELSKDTVRVRIYGRILDKNYTELLYHNSGLELPKVILLDKVQKKKNILLTTEQVKELRRKGLIEGRKPNYFVSAKIARIMNEKVKYTKNKAFDKQYYMDMIEKFIIQYSSATRKEIDDLITDKLPDYMDNKQKRSKVHNLMSEMVRDKRILNIGSKFKSKWVKFR